MDDTDRNILNLIQNNFPITGEPCKELAHTLNITEEELIERIKKLEENNIIREIGPVFSSKHLGYKSTLVTMKVQQEKLKETVEIINSYYQVTHNYGRAHEYNLWFTLICESDEEINRIIEDIKCRTGINEIYNLPAKKMFKIKVSFDF
ncbi:MAG: AsnC family transcriptional regulator [Candidatus Eremiobacterota bacterium]